MINFQVVLLFAKYRNTSEERVILATCLADNLKILVLSDMIVAGKPYLPANQHNAVHIKSFSKFKVHSPGKGTCKQTKIYFIFPCLSFVIDIQGSSKI